MPIEINNISKIFRHESKNILVLDRIKLKIKDGEFLTIFGPNGCGKTTLLNIIADLEKPSDGSIKINNKPIGNARVGFVFQNYQESLFPWRTVKGNVEIALESIYKNKQNIEKISKSYIKEVGLLKFSNKYPYQLSGGMKQLVAIVRALAYNPDLFLMDEPFSALDYDNRISMEEKLLDLWTRHKKTVIFVSHDIDEAVFLADRVVILSKRPAKIKAIIDIALQRPRTIETRFEKEFHDIKNKILRIFKEELV